MGVISSGDTFGRSGHFLLWDLSQYSFVRSPLTPKERSISTPLVIEIFVDIIHDPGGSHLGAIHSPQLGASHYWPKLPDEIRSAVLKMVT